MYRAAASPASKASHVRNSSSKKCTVQSFPSIPLPLRFLSLRQATTAGRLDRLEQELRGEGHKVWCRRPGSDGQGRGRARRCRQGHYGAKGTTCATVLTRAIFAEGCKSVEAGVNAMDLRRGITMAVDSVVTNLKISRARMINTSEEIAQVGTISANREREIGELIAKAMEKVGKEGVITISDGKTLYNELEVVEGMKLDRGYIYPLTSSANQKNQKELDDPLILIHEKIISSINAVVKRQRPLLIVAEDVET